MVSVVKLFFILNVVTVITHMISLLTLIPKQTLNPSQFSNIVIELEQPLETAPILRSKNPFKCLSDSGSIILKEFYQLDCENAFLKNISQWSMDESTDVCEMFNEAFDGNQKHMSQISLHC
jgi:hypothetical protein